MLSDGTRRDHLLCLKRLEVRYRADWDPLPNHGSLDKAINENPGIGAVRACGADKLEQIQILDHACQQIFFQAY